MVKKQQNQAEGDRSDPVAPTLPSNPKLLRSLQRAIHEFAEQLESDVDVAIRDSQRRRLDAIRAVEETCSYLRQRYAVRRHEAEEPNLAEKPDYLVISSDLALALRYVDPDQFATRLAELHGAIEPLQEYEGVRFLRKMFTLRKGEKPEEPQEPAVLDPEEELIDSLESQAALLIKLFRDLEDRFAERLMSGGGKGGRGAKAAKPASQSENGPGSWCHTADEQPPPEFKFGPLQGKKKDLAKAYFGNPKADPRTITTACAEGQMWIKPLRRYNYLAFFKDEKVYAETKRILTKLQNPAS